MQDRHCTYCANILTPAEVGMGMSGWRCADHGLMVKCADCGRHGTPSFRCWQCQESLKERIKALKKAVRVMLAHKECDGRGELEKEYEAGSGVKVWVRCECRKELEEILKGKL